MILTLIYAAGDFWLYSSLHQLEQARKEAGGGEQLRFFSNRAWERSTGRLLTATMARKAAAASFVRV